MYIHTYIHIDAPNLVATNQVADYPTCYIATLLLVYCMAFNTCMCLSTYMAIATIF